MRNRVSNLMVVMLIISHVLGSVFWFCVRAQSAVTISDILVTTTDTTATISWSTNVPTNEQIKYGLTDQYTMSYRSDVQVSTYHSVTISNLAYETTYHFSVIATMGGTSVSSFDRLFKTQKGKDRIMPVIDDVNLVYLTGTSATFQWTTSENASSVVRCGTTSKYTGTASGAGNTKIHDVTYGGLRIATTYHCRVESQDNDSNVAYGNDIQFTTLLSGEAEKQQLAILNVLPTSSDDPAITYDSVTITWSTNKLSIGGINYGVNTNIGSWVGETGFRSFNHSITLKNLQSGTRYYFRVQTRDVFGASVYSDIASVVIKKKPTQVVTRRIRVLGMTTTGLTWPNYLMRSRDNDAVYAVLSGQRYRLTSKQAILDYGFQLKDVQEVSTTYLNRFPLVHLVKSPDDNQVYHLYRRPGDRVLKIAIPTPTIFSSYPQNSWNDLVVISKEDLNSYPTATLVKTSGSKAVYLIEAGACRPFMTESAFVERGYSFSDVVEISPMHLNYFEVGDPLE